MDRGRVKQIISRVLKTFWGVLLATLIFYAIVFFIGVRVTQFFMPNWPCRYDNRTVIPEISSASFDPDHTIIAFSLKHPRFHGIYLMDDKGKVLWEVIRNSEEIKYFSPAWSPDGRHIACVGSTKENGWHLYLIHWKSKKVRKITDTRHFDRDPKFSPDGKSMYFVRSRHWGNYSPVARPSFHENDIMAIDIETLQERSITDRAFYDLRNPQPLPDDENMVAFISSQLLDNNGTLRNAKPFKENGFNIWLFKINDPYKATIILPDMSKFVISDTEYYSRLYHPVVSKDGRSMLFTCGSCQRPTHVGRIYRYDFNTKEGSQVVSLGATQLIPLDLTRDNRKVLFIHDLSFPLMEYFYASNLWICDIDGRNIRNFVLDFSLAYPEEKTDP